VFIGTSAQKLSLSNAAPGSGRPATSRAGRRLLAELSDVLSRLKDLALP
jgi:hypothetical protein